MILAWYVGLLVLGSFQLQTQTAHLNFPEPLGNLEPQYPLPGTAAFLRMVSEIPAESEGILPVL